MNEKALRLTRQSGQAHFWSSSRQSLWRKGETSGNVLEVVELRVDCDADTLLLRVHAAGPACHTGERSCFYRKIEEMKG
jgi:phosphoribosyl-AMP cyclohydrolase